MLEMSRAVGGYLRAVTLDALATGALAGIGLALAGVPFPLALGAITAVGEYVPYVGTTLAAVPAILVGLLVSPQKAILAAIVYVVVQQIEGHLLTPNIMRSQTNVPQALVVIALFGGFVVGGVLGALVAVPIAGAVKVLVERVVAPAVRRWSHAEPAGAV
jgi:predicted PurR-regulated permease PerM